MSVRDRLVLRLDGGEPCTQRRQLVFHLLARVVGCIQLALEGIQFLNAGLRAGFLFGDEGFVEGLPVKVLRPFPQIGAACPVEDVRQFPHHIQRLFRRWHLVAVYRHVARLPDVLRLLPHGLGREFTEDGIAEVASRFVTFGDSGPSPP